MKDTKSKRRIFDEALKQGARDLANEMGYKGERKHNSTNGTTNEQGRFAGIISFIKSTLQQVKKVNHGRV